MNSLDGLYTYGRQKLNRGDLPEDEYFISGLTKKGEAIRLKYQKKLEQIPLKFVFLPENATLIKSLMTMNEGRRRKLSFDESLQRFIDQQLSQALSQQESNLAPRSY